jgi:hypothetical protein
MSQKIKAYIIRVSDEGLHYKGYLGEVSNDLKSKQKIVGGYIEVVPITPEIDAIVNEDGKNKCLPLNRLLLDEDRNIVDCIVGNIICVRHCGDEFADIKAEDREIIESRLIPITRLDTVQREDGLKQFVIYMRPEEAMLDYGGSDE